MPQLSWVLGEPCGLGMGERSGLEPVNTGQATLGGGLEGGPGLVLRKLLRLSFWGRGTRRGSESLLSPRGNLEGETAPLRGLPLLSPSTLPAQQEGNISGRGLSPEREGRRVGGGEAEGARRMWGLGQPPPVQPHGSN